MMHERIVTLACLGLFAVSCANAPTPGRSDLYTDLGGQAGIEAIVDSFLRELAADERIIHHFKETKISRFRKHLIEQFCNLAGGPCEYTGDSMVEVHRGMGVSEGDFNALVEDLIDAMEANDVPTSAQNRLLALLAPMHGEIVERKHVRKEREARATAPAPASNGPGR